MEIKKAAMAGTLESSDAQVTVEPGQGGIELSIESSVIHQFGRQIMFQIAHELHKIFRPHIQINCWGQKLQPHIMADHAANTCIGKYCKVCIAQFLSLVPVSPFFSH